MDKTITRQATWTRFLIFAAKQRAPWRLLLLPLAAVAAVGYALKLTDRRGLKKISQSLLLGRALAPAEMKKVAEGFADAELAHGVLEGARARIEADRAAGYHLVMATASHGYYAAAIARRLGFDAVVATKARRDSQDHILSDVDGDNCYGAAKLRMVCDWLAQIGIQRTDLHVRAYSDHVSDAPLLDWADEGYAVNAHAPLTKLAAEKGWQSFDWR